MRLEQLKKGKPLLFKPDNSNGVIPCVVLEVSGNHAKAEIDGGTLWINAETIEQFHETTLEDLAKVIVGFFLDPWEIEPEMVSEITTRIRTEGIRETYNAIRNALAA